jgi:hypothetical protein
MRCSAADLGADPRSARSLLCRVDGDDAPSVEVLWVHDAGDRLARRFRLRVEGKHRKTEPQAPEVNTIMANGRHGALLR